MKLDWLKVSASPIQSSRIAPHRSQNGRRCRTHIIAVVTTTNTSAR
jgi:hypothetical protein